MEEKLNEFLQKLEEAGLDKDEAKAQIEEIIALKAKPAEDDDLEVEEKEEEKTEDLNSDDELEEKEEIESEEDLGEDEEDLKVEEKDELKEDLGEDEEEKAEEKEPVFDEDQKEALDRWVLIPKIRSYRKLLRRALSTVRRKRKTNQST